MSRATWKRTERNIAGIIGGERVPVSGRQRGDQPDVRHDWLSVEVKHRRSIPQWLTTALTQARAAVRGDQFAGGDHPPARRSAHRGHRLPAARGLRAMVRAGRRK